MSNSVNRMYKREHLTEMIYQGFKDCEGFEGSVNPLKLRPKGCVYAHRFIYVMCILPGRGSREV